MTELVLTDEQVELMRRATDDVLLRDSQGHVVGVASLASEPPRGGWYVENEAEILERIRQRRNLQHRWYTTEEVWGRLQTLTH
jgi:hypothetical protein